MSKGELETQLPGALPDRVSRRTLHTLDTHQLGAFHRCGLMWHFAAAGC